MDHLPFKGWLMGWFKDFKGGSGTVGISISLNRNAALLTWAAWSFSCFLQILSAHFFQSLVIPFDLILILG